MSQFPPFRSAQPKGHAKPEPFVPEPSDDLPTRDPVPIEERPAEWEHVRVCAKCHSTEVVEAVRIGDALYVKVT